MKNKALVQILVLFISLLYLGCDPVDRRLLIVNNNNCLLYLSMDHSSSIKGIKSKILEAQQNGLKVDFQNFFEIIKPKEKKQLLLTGSDAWMKYVLNSNNKSLNLFYFCKELEEKHTLMEVIDKSLYKHNVIPLDTLEKYNWVVELE